MKAITLSRLLMKQNKNRHGGAFLMAINALQKNAKKAVSSDMTRLSNNDYNDRKIIIHNGAMNAYIQNVSYCKRSIRDMKTYQKECK